MPDEEVGKLWRTCDEETDPVDAEIVGQIPECIKGIFLRVGPGKFDFDTGNSVNHYFDGYAILSKYTIRGGSSPGVKFESKYLDSDAYKDAIANQKPMVNEFGTRGCVDPNKSYISRIMSVVAPNLTDNCNYNIMSHGKDTFVMGETSSFHELNVNSLTSVCRHDTPKYFGFYLFTAHPLRDTKTGYTYNIGTSIKTGLKHNILQIPPKSSSAVTSKEHFKKNAKVICSINSRWNSLASLNHSFGMTKNYIVFIEQPFVINIGKFLSTGLFRNEPLRNWLEWHPDCKNRFHIIDRENGKLLKTEILSSEPFFFLHVINCYEENHQLVIDVSIYEDATVFELQYLSDLRNGSCFYEERVQASIKRFVLPIIESNSSLVSSPENTNLVSQGCAMRQGKTITVFPELLANKGLEMLAINPMYFGLDYTYSYGTSLTGRGNFERCIAKVNMKTKETFKWCGGKSVIVGEVAFIPNTFGQRKGAEKDEIEDDGYLIVPSMDLREGFPDHLFFIDCKTMTEVGRAVFNIRLPPALHGHYIPSIPY